MRALTLPSERSLYNVKMSYLAAPGRTDLYRGYLLTTSNLKYV